MSLGTSHHAPPSPHGRKLWTLALGALGIVYGDIGTSPLYALKESFNPTHGIPLSTDNVLGILSLVFWALTLVVSLKYLTFILRADNQGEGGIMALLALLIPGLRSGAEKDPSTARRKARVIFLGLFGAALLYGDGVITPAISVLSAVEGIELLSPTYQPMVVPLTVTILFFLFLMQSRGMGRIGTVFGSAMLVWFVVLVATGLPWILRHPSVLAAMNPLHAARFFAENGKLGFLALGAVVLCITGGEALYADMGHFGKKPIRLGWYGLVLPALLVNYFGQGALILERGEAALANPFYGLVSGEGTKWMLVPLIAIATMATVIASQALISGAFSLTQQAVQLGYLPRMTIRHTSRQTEGQIYVPRVNMLLMISCVLLVLWFQESTRLAAAYGIAVTGTMAITSLLYFRVVRDLWKWAPAKAIGLVLVFIAIDLAFFGANLVKFFDGGWVPILVAIWIFTLMTTWKRGRETLAQLMYSASVPLEEFVERIVREDIRRVKGTAVFLTLSRDIAPSVLLHHLKHNHAIHEKVILLSIITEHRPEVERASRVALKRLSHGFVKLTARYGYMESPDITEIIEYARADGMEIKNDQLSFYLGRETIIPTGKTGMAGWRKKLFMIFSRNARPATEYFRIPPDHVIEIGAQIRI